MGSICGIIYKNESAGQEVIQKMLDSMSGWNPDHTHFTIRENMALGAHVLYTMKYSHMDKQDWEDDRYIYVYDGRFDLDEAASLSFPEPGKQDSDAAIVSGNNYQEKILAYLRKNIESQNFAFKGEYAVAAWDKRDKKLIGIRDRLGTRPFYYTETDRFFAFATEMKALFILPGVERIPDEQWIADSISTIKSEKFRTPYKNIYRLLPAHAIIFNGAKAILQQYWDLAINPEWTNLEEEEAVEIFREKLKIAVERRTKHAISVGSELSGGLDSSGVTALACEVAKRNRTGFFAFSHAFSETNTGKYFPFKDEREYSKALVEFAGITEHVLCTAENYGIIDSLKKSMGHQSGPTQQSYSIFADSLYEEAQKREVRVLLSGFGGDEGVTSKAAGYIQELWKNKNWQTLKQEIRGTTGKKPSGKTKAAFKYFLMRYLPRLFSLAQNILSEEDWRISKWEALALHPEFEKKMSLKKRYFEMVGMPDEQDVRKRQYQRILHNHVSLRFEYSYLDALYRRMEYAYPLWDIDLVEFYYSLPSRLKLKNGQKRYLYREAMKGIIPEIIRNRNDKTGATVPTISQRFHKDYKAIETTIQKAKKESQQKYLDHEKLSQWQKKILNRDVNEKTPATPGAFFNSLQILMWEP